MVLMIKTQKKFLIQTTRSGERRWRNFSFLAQQTSNGRWTRKKTFINLREVDIPRKTMFELKLKENGNSLKDP